MVTVVLYVLIQIDCYSVVIA